jgi:RNA polymerase sigma-70 factor (ECF subfamily)
MIAIYLSMLDTEEDKQTFTEIYEQLKLPCYHVALKITNNTAMAEDAVHNAFLAVIRHKEKIFQMTCGKRKSQIVIITKNKAIDILRNEKLHNHSLIDEADEAELAFDFDISRILETQELYEHLKNCIASLSERYKSVIELKYIHDMGNQEIAELLGITPKTVSMRISRAKAMLLEIMKKDDD